MKFLLSLLIFSVIYFTHAQSSTIDQSFANNGMLISHINLSGYNMANSCEKTWEGRIVMAVESMQRRGYEIYVLRILDNGIIDSIFGVNGYAY